MSEYRIYYLQKETMFLVVRMINCFLVVLNFLFIFSPNFEIYHTWTVFLVPVLLYILLCRVSLAFKQYESKNGFNFYYLEFIIFNGLIILIICNTGGISSPCLILVLLPVLFFKLVFGFRLSVLVSAANLLLVAALIFSSGNINAYNLKAVVVLGCVFFLITLFVGRGNHLINFSTHSYRPVKYCWESSINKVDQHVFENELQKIINYQDRDYKVGVILIEISKYSSFKEQWGQTASTILLRNIDRSLKNFIDENEEYAVHFEEAKFAVVTIKADSSILIGKAEKLRRRLVGDIAKSLEDEWKLPVAVGVSIFPDHGSKIEELVERAKIALNRAAAAGGERIQVYYPIVYRMEGKYNSRQNKLLNNMLQTIYERFKFIYEHGERVSIYSQIVCSRLDLSLEQRGSIEWAALLHDIGKIEWESNFETGKIAYGEIKEQQNHPLKGGEVLSQLKLNSSIISSVIYHHEKYNGSGYPYGIKNTEIPLGARVISAANFFDYLTADTPYGEGRSIEEGVQYLMIHRESFLDPEVVDAFVNSLNEFDSLSSIIEWPKNVSKILPSGNNSNNYVLGGHYLNYYFGDVHFITKAFQCISTAISNNEKCVLLMDDKKEKELLKQLQGKGIGTILPSSLGKASFFHSLLRITEERARVEFEIKKLIKMWSDKAEEEGFDYLRLIIDQSYFNFYGESLGILEEMLTRFIMNLDAVIVCYYDINLLSQEDIKLLEKLHDEPFITTNSTNEEEKNAT